MGYTLHSYTWSLIISVVTLRSPEHVLLLTLLKVRVMIASLLRIFFRITVQTLQHLSVPVRQGDPIIIHDFGNMQ